MSITISRKLTISAIFLTINSFLSPPQITFETLIGRTKASQTMKALWMPEYSGMARTIHASPVVINNVAINSLTINFHMPSMLFFISSFDFLSAPCMCIHVLPNSGPYQIGPRIKPKRVTPMIATQLREVIERIIRVNAWVILCISQIQTTFFWFWRDIE